MPFGLGVGQLVGVVRDAKRVGQSRATIDISGPGASELALALVAGGDVGAVQVGGDPTRVAAAVRLIGDEPSETDMIVLRRIARAVVPLVVVRRGRSGAPVPYVLPEFVVEAGAAALPVEEVTAALAACLGDEGAGLAARLPALRAEVAARIVHETALTNAAIAAVPWVRRSHLPLLTLPEARMLFRLGVARGEALPSDPQALAVAAAPVLGSAIGAGLVARLLYRRLPLHGPLVAAAVAYAGTRALGEARARL